MSRCVVVASVTTSVVAASEGRRGVGDGVGDSVGDDVGNVIVGVGGSP
jgi:hypothetical protein